MANEKMMILKMLEEGKITSVEAAKLLESADGINAASGTSSRSSTNRTSGAHSASSASHMSGTHGTSSASHMSGTHGTSGGEAYRGNDPGAHAYGTADTRSASGGTSGRGFEDLTGDLSRKFEAFAREMEPKIQRFTETVAEKIVSGADRISKSLSAESSASARSSAPSGAGRPVSPARPVSPSRSGGAPRAAAPASAASVSSSAAPVSAGGFEKNIELTVNAGYNELNLSGLNGDVRVKGYNGDKITARLAYKPKRSGAVIDLMKLGGKYYLSYEEDDFERVSIDAYVPERLFHVVNISGINGNLDVSSLAARDMQFSNANGQTRLAGLAAENIKADCSTGRLTLAGLAADSAIIENFNGVVEAGELDIAKLSLTNYNGGMTLLMSAFAKYAEYLWSVETSNAKLVLNLPTLPDLGYHIKAHTTLGEIRLGLTGMQFIINDPALVEARSVYYDRLAKKVRLTAETSNAPLTIN